MKLVVNIVKKIMNLHKEIIIDIKKQALNNTYFQNSS